MKFLKILKFFLILSLSFAFASCYEESAANQESSILYSRYMSNLRNRNTIQNENKQTVKLII